MSRFSKFSLLRHLVVSILIICLFGFGGYKYLNSLHTRYGPEGVVEQKVVKQDIAISIQPDTLITQKMIYIRCDDSEIYKTKPAKNLIGLTKNQLQKVYPDWIIDEFSAKNVIMHYNVDSLCKEHANNTFVGLKDGYVAIFYGKPGRKSIVKELTKIPVETLSPQDLKELQKGIVIENRAQLLKTLEGIQSK